MTNKIIKKVTPTHTFDWYVKWGATFFALAALCTRAAGYDGYDLAFALNSAVGWLLVGILWHDRALLVLNAAAIALIGTSLARLLV